MLEAKHNSFMSAFGNLMKRIRIIHDTEYHYHTPVAFGPHRALLRPREGHDVHIDSAVLEVMLLTGWKFPCKLSPSENGKGPALGKRACASSGAD